jgi:type IV secretory pathway TrbF-like protein
MIMAAALKNTPIYEDQLIAWHNQRLWWLLCGAGAIILAQAITTAIWLHRAPPPPYVIEVNAKGEPVGAVQPVLGTESVNDNVIRYAISEFIDHAFRIERDFEEEKMLLTKVYAMSTSQASKMLTDYYHANKDANDPLMAGSKFWQEVRVLRTLRLPAPDTYEVDYQTLKYSNNDDSVATTNWRATLQIATGRPTDINTLGLYISSLDFSPEAKQ